MRRESGSVMPSSGMRHGWTDGWKKKRRIGCRCWWLKGCGRGKEISILMMEGGSSKELHKRGKRWDRTGRVGLLFKICNRKKFISINLRCPAQKGHTWHWTDILHDKNLLVYTDFVYFWECACQQKKCMHTSLFAFIASYLQFDLNPKKILGFETCKNT